MTKTDRQKLKTKAALYRAAALLFLILQLPAYIGEFTNRESAGMSGGRRTGYFIGLSFFLYISLAFFYLDYKARKKMKTITSDEDLEAIGKDE